MDELGLFTAALGLSAPWRVTRTEFDGERLDLYLDFPRGARFACPAKDCAQGACPVHDVNVRGCLHERPGVCDTRAEECGYPTCSCSCALVSAAFRAPVHDGEVWGWLTSGRWWSSAAC